MSSSCGEDLGREAAKDPQAGISYGGVCGKTSGVVSLQRHLASSSLGLLSLSHTQVASSDENLAQVLMVMKETKCNLKSIPGGGVGVLADGIHPAVSTQ